MLGDKISHNINYCPRLHPQAGWPQTDCKALVWSKIVSVETTNFDHILVLVLGVKVCQSSLFQNVICFCTKYQLTKIYACLARDNFLERDYSRVA